MRVLNYQGWRYVAWSALVAAACIFAGSESVQGQNKGKGGGNRGGGNRGGGAAQRWGGGRAPARAARPPASRGPSAAPAARAPDRSPAASRPEPRVVERPRAAQPNRPDVDRTPDRGRVEARRPSLDRDVRPDRPDQDAIERIQDDRPRLSRDPEDAREAAREATRDAREDTRDAVRNAREEARDTTRDARDAARRDADRPDSREAREDVRDERPDARSEDDRQRRTVDRATRDRRDRVQDSLRRAIRNADDPQRSLARWDERNRDRIRDFEDRGDRIRDRFRRSDRRFYDSRWWRGRNNIIGLSFGRGFGRWGFGNVGWGYRPWLGYRPYGYWWGQPSWVSLVGWMPWGWNDPYYYHYGPGGNVVYRSNYVYVNGQPVGTPESYYESALALADVDPRNIDPNDRDWRPLGTFTMAVRDDEVDPDRILQLAVNQEGLISGTVFNQRSGNLYTVQGRVDPDTQRVAFTIGDDTSTVLETGLYNLTQDQTSLLIHFNEHQKDTYMLARLPAPEELDARAAEQPTPEIAR